MVGLFDTGTFHQNCHVLPRINLLWQLNIRTCDCQTLGEWDRLIYSEGEAAEEKGARLSLLLLQVAARFRREKKSVTKKAPLVRVFPS